MKNKVIKFKIGNIILTMKFGLNPNLPIIPNK